MTKKIVPAASQGQQQQPPQQQNQNQQQQQNDPSQEAENQTKRAIAAEAAKQRLGEILRMIHESDRIAMQTDRLV